MVKVSKQRSAFKKDITEFHSKCLRLSRCADVKAIMYYYLNHLCSFCIILSGAVIGALGVFKGCENKFMIALGFIVTSLKLGMSIYSPEKKSVQLKMVAQQLSKLSREVKRLGTLNMEQKFLEERLDQYREEFDSIDLSMYDITVNSRIVNLLSKGIDEDPISSKNNSVPASRRGSLTTIQPPEEEDIKKEDGMALP